MENEVSPPSIHPESPKPKRFKRSIFIVLLVLGIGFLGWYFAQRKSVGEITVLDPVASKKVAEEEKLTKYEGKYFTFLYPKSFEARYDAHDVKFPLLERQLLSRIDLEGQKIAVTVQDLNSSSLEEYSSYRLRTLEKESYQEEKYEKNGLKYTFFIKKSSVFEAGAFFEIKKKAVSIILSSPTQANGLREELVALIDTLEVEEEK